MFHLFALVSILFVWLNNSPETFEKYDVSKRDHEIQVILKSGEIVKDKISKKKVSEFTIVVLDPSGVEEYEVRKFRVLLSGQAPLEFKGNSAKIDTRESTVCAIKIDELLRLSPEGPELEQMDLSVHIFMLEE